MCVLHLDLCTITPCTRVVYHLFDKGCVADGTVAKSRVASGSVAKKSVRVSIGSVAKKSVANGYFESAEDGSAAYELLAEVSVAYCS